MKILGKTIWVPKIFFSTDWSYRNIKRIYFPVIYTLYLLSAILGILFGVPAIKDAFGEPEINLPLYFAVLFSLMCLLGAIFPKLKHLETAGSVLLLGVASMYLVTSAIVVFTIDPHRVFGLILTLVAITPLFARISLIGGELQTTRTGKKT